VAVRWCRFCEAPVQQPRGRVKEFCNSAHRAAYREREHQKALALAVEAIDNLRDEFEAGLAKLAGAKELLQRFQKKKTTNEKKDLTENPTCGVLIRSGNSARPSTQPATGRDARGDRMTATTTKTTCPGCNGQGAATKETVAVLKCQSCGGVFTYQGIGITMEMAMLFVAVHLPMQANAGAEGQFYFDFIITRPSDNGRQRMHGWADRATRRVVQWG
jgi:hypothetical protein